jgi:hypothetical protein
MVNIAQLSRKSQGYIEGWQPSKCAIQKPIGKSWKSHAANATEARNAVPVRRKR